MRFRFEKRAEPSRLMLVATPIGAVLLTMVIGAILFEALGYDGVSAVKEIFLTPILASYKWQDVAAKAAPLILIGLGLSVSNRAKIWNIGAEGQYVIGALSGAGVALVTQGAQGFWIIPLMLLAGIAGGMAWSAVPALLKIRFRVNEILSSLMLTYVALQVLNYLITGPWKDPKGHNFPQTAPFTDAQLLPHTIAGTPVSPGLAVAVALSLVFWLLMSRSVFGYQIKVVGAAPHAARYGGFGGPGTIWLAMLIGGGMAGLAGIIEASSQSGQINLGFPSGYGFTAIIVAFLGRLHPIGVLIAGIVLAISYVGGQVAQSAVHVPNATAGIFQAMMLFLLLASDILVRYRLKWVPSRGPVALAGDAA